MTTTWRNHTVREITLSGLHSETGARGGETRLSNLGGGGGEWVIAIESPEKLTEDH